MLHSTSPCAFKDSLSPTAGLGTVLKHVTSGQSLEDSLPHLQAELVLRYQDTSCVFISVSIVSSDQPMLLSRLLQG